MTNITRSSTRRIRLLIPTYEDLSPEVVHEVKRRVIDSFGCALGAWNEEPCAIARKVASDFSAKNGAHDYRHQSPGAARLGGIRDRLLHSLFRLQRHLSFQRTGASERQHRRGARRRRKASARMGRELITAIALAYEVQCRFCDAASIRARGWDHPTYGAFSTALAAAQTDEA